MYNKNAVLLVPAQMYVFWYKEHSTNANSIYTEITYAVYNMTDSYIMKAPPCFRAKYNINIPVRALDKAFALLVEALERYPWGWKVWHK